MVKVVLMHNGKVELVEVSQETLEQLQQFAWKNKHSVSDVIGSVYDNFGEVPEQFIPLLATLSPQTVERLKLFAQRNNMPVSEIIDDTYNTYQEISEHQIIEYLNVSGAHKD